VPLYALAAAVRDCDPEAGVLLDAVAAVVLRRRTYSLSEGVLVRLESGGYVWCRPDRLPEAQLTLEAELAFRKRLLEDDRENLRRSWDLSAPSQPETISDVLFQAARSHVGQGRAPRSARRVVVRGNSSRGDPDPSDESDLARSPRRAAR
jgi:hypothetical protein